MVEVPRTGQREERPRLHAHLIVEVTRSSLVQSAHLLGEGSVLLIALYVGMCQRPVKTKRLA